MPRTIAGMKKGVKPEITENYIRFRIEMPDKFKKGSFRTDDIGRVGYTKRIAGIKKYSGKWATQSFLISKKESPKKYDQLVENISRTLERKGYKLDKRAAKAAKKRLE